ncbi:MAG TPA: peptidoglycan-binding domain-containing protein, partial [Bauldia sp.]|nr:peptidoglycan-binding domain-containing protein [Bauldia sp.]
LVPKNNANWRGPWDCAEFMSWLVYQDGGFLYGCVDNAGDPATVEAYTGAWKTDSANRGQRVPVEQAAGTVGGIVLRYPPGPGTMGHIAICDGTGRTIEAQGKAFGVVEHVVHGRRWDTGVLIPGIYYEVNGAGILVQPPPVIFGVNAPFQNKETVRRIQQALFDLGIDPGPIDGIYGSKTAAAVAAFQTMRGLVVDGEVGPQTSAALGIQI